MQKWTEAMKTFASACALLALAAGMARPAKAGGLGADTIGLFPKSVGEFAYADLKKARTMKWYPALEQQMLPEKFKQFEKFLAAAGIDTNSQVDELAWALVPEAALSRMLRPRARREQARRQRMLRRTAKRSWGSRSAATTRMP